MTAIPASVTTAPLSRDEPPIANLRWWIAGLLALATALSYLDRQSFPFAVARIRDEIPISNAEFARINSLFLLAYAVMYAVGGRVMDRLGTRVGYAVMILFWSGATLATAAARSVFGLGACRFLLGVGEGGGFPGSGKAVAEWFPARERSLAFGIFNTGSSVGALVAPPLVAVISLQLGWRWIFILTGAAGFVWAAAWLIVYQTPDRSRRIGSRELELIRAAHAAERRDEPSDQPVRWRWTQLLRHRAVWGLMTTKFLADSAWYFFIFWLPRYLYDVRGLDTKQIGMYGWIPYACMGGGSLAGGWLGATLIRRGTPLDRARKITLGIGAALMPVSLLVAASPLSWAIVFLSIAFFAHQFWSANIQTLAADIFPPRVVGSVEGLLGSAGSFGGMLSGLAVGTLVTSHGYGPAFMLAGLLHPVSYLIILTVVRRIEPAP